jgi:hypothetical protein
MQTMCKEKIMAKKFIIKLPLLAVAVGFVLTSMGCVHLPVFLGGDGGNPYRVRTETKQDIEGETKREKLPLIMSTNMFMQYTPVLSLVRTTSGNGRSSYSLQSAYITTVVQVKIDSASSIRIPHPDLDTDGRGGVLFYGDRLDGLIKSLRNCKKLILQMNINTQFSPPPDWLNNRPLDVGDKGIEALHKFLQ